MDEHRMECLVIGAGTAGAAVAYFLAAKGVRVTLVDARERRNVGASWLNGVELSLFDDLELPEPPEGVIYHAAERFIMQAGDEGPRVVIDRPPVVEVDMRALNQWLLDLAESAGVTLRFRTRAVVGDGVPGGRRVSLRGSEEVAQMVVDASGVTLATDDAFIPELDQCTAYQAVYRITKPDAARDWLHAQDLRLGDTLSRGAVEGGYSILNTCVFDGAERLAVLTGVMHREGYRSAGRVAADFVRAHAWIGAKEFGGGGLIPLRAPSPTFAEHALLRIGNSAGHVFPAHGSGVALGIRAAALASNTVAAALQVGDVSERGLWSFHRDYYTGMGKVCLEYQPLRYLSASFSVEEFRLALRSGLIDATALADGLAQRPLAPRLSPLTGAWRCGIELLPLAPRFATAVALAFALRKHAASIPARGAHGEVAAWLGTYQKLMKRAQALALSGTPDGSLPSLDSAEA